MTREVSRRAVELRSPTRAQHTTGEVERIPVMSSEQHARQGRREGSLPVGVTRCGAQPEGKGEGCEEVLPEGACDGCDGHCGR